MQNNRIKQIELRLEKLEKGIEQLLNNSEKLNSNKCRQIENDDGLQGDSAKKVSDEVAKNLSNKQGLKCFSYFSNGDVSSNSIYACDIESIKHIDSIEAERWITAFASMERIEILVKLLEKNCSGAELMEKIGFSTTGKLYHHINYLINIGVVKNDNGVYHLVANMVGTVLMLLASAHNFCRRLKKISD